MASASTVSMKLLIDGQNNRVLFAEASKETVDFLFCILSLPVATVIRLLTKQGMVGSLANLYESVENLNISYILPNQTKETLLKPRPPAGISSVPLLLMNDAKTSERKFFKCSYNYCQSCSISDDPRAICPNCSQLISTAVTYVTPLGNQVSNTEGGFVKGVVTYMIMDNLVVKPMSTISSIALLNQFNVKDVGILKEKVVTLGMDEAVKLLKASLQSETVLSDVLLNCK
ncbi:uncharacterized protein [Henckelia pumila]|uniref:uncharacterized protein n=1 Tax=Henckelia pumila TaxID=405737 RepID=UPI003C6E7C7A